MNPARAEDLVVEVFRRAALRGAERPVDVDAPLGELGMGLDSLALVEFLVALENELDVEIGEGIWTRRGQLTLRDFIGEVSAQAGDLPDTVPAAPPGPAPREGPDKPGRWRKAVDSAVHRFVYLRTSLVIIAKDLTQDWSYRENETGIEVRPVTLEDISWLEEKKPGWMDTRKRRSFRGRMDRDYLGLCAVKGRELVGLDWIAFSGDEDPDTGLSIRTGPDSCFGLDLFEKRSGEGIGLRLLAASLHTCRERGYRTQFTHVLASNTRMLSASVQFFGFRKVGTIEVRRYLRKPLSRWRYDGRSGLGGTLDFGSA